MTGFLFTVAFPFLTVLAVRNWTDRHWGPEAFEDPGGWKLPRGDVAMIGSAVAALIVVAVVGAVAPHM